MEEEGTEGGKPPGTGESPGQDTTSSERHSGGWEPGASHPQKGASETYRDNLISKMLGKRKGVASPISNNM